METILETLIKWIIRRITQGILILILALNFIACASAPAVSPEEDKIIAEILAQYDEKGEKYQVGLSPWEVEERDGKIKSLEERLSTVEELLLQTREAVGEAFSAIVELEKMRLKKMRGE